MFTAKCISWIDISMITMVFRYGNIPHTYYRKSVIGTCKRFACCIIFWLIHLMRDKDLNLQYLDCEPCEVNTLFMIVDSHWKHSGVGEMHVIGVHGPCLCVCTQPSFVPCSWELACDIVNIHCFDFNDIFLCPNESGHIDGQPNALWSSAWKWKAHYKKSSLRQGSESPTPQGFAIASFVLSCRVVCSLSIGSF